MNNTAIIKDIQKLEKKNKKRLKSLIIAFLAEYDTLNDLAANLNGLAKDIKDEIKSINDQGIVLANKHSDINNKPKKDKKEGLIITTASMNLARKAAGYTISDDDSVDIK